RRGPNKEPRRGGRKHRNQPSKSAMQIRARLTLGGLVFATPVEPFTERRQIGASSGQLALIQAGAAAMLFMMRGSFSGGRLHNDASGRVRIETGFMSADSFGAASEALQLHNRKNNGPQYDHAPDAQNRPLEHRIARRQAIDCYAGCGNSAYDDE